MQLQTRRTERAHVGSSSHPPLTSRGPDWFTDAHRAGPGAADLLTSLGAEHSLEGIAGHRVAEATDEQPERVALVGRVTAAYLRAALSSDGRPWTELTNGLAAGAHPLGRLDRR